MGFKNAYERSKEVIIDTNLDIGTKELKNIVTHAKGQTDAVMAGFCLGYLQGQKSLEKKMRKCPGGKLKCKNQIRQAIFYHISFLTSIPSLKLVMEFADILRRWDSKSQEESLTNEEWNQMVIVQTIMDCKNKEILQGIRVFANEICKESR